MSLPFCDGFDVVLMHLLSKRPYVLLQSFAVRCLQKFHEILLFSIHNLETCYYFGFHFSHPILQVAHLMDIALFYAIPSLLRIFFDGIVLFQCYSPFSMMDVPLYERRYAISVPTHTRR